MDSASALKSKVNQFLEMASPDAIAAADRNTLDDWLVQALALADGLDSTRSLGADVKAMELIIRELHKTIWNFADRGQNKL